MPLPPRRRPAKTASGRLEKRIVKLPDGRYLILYTPVPRAE